MTAESAPERRPRPTEATVTQQKVPKPMRTFSQPAEPCAAKEMRCQPAAGAGRTRRALRGSAVDPPSGAWFAQAMTARSSGQGVGRTRGHKKGGRGQATERRRRCFSSRQKKQHSTFIYGIASWKTPKKRPEKCNALLPSRACAQRPHGLTRHATRLRTGPEILTPWFRSPVCQPVLQ